MRVYSVNFNKIYYRLFVNLYEIPNFLYLTEAFIFASLMRIVMGVIWDQMILMIHFIINIMNTHE